MTLYETQKAQQIPPYAALGNSGEETPLEWRIPPAEPGSGQTAICPGWTAKWRERATSNRKHTDRLLGPVHSGNLHLSSRRAHVSFKSQCNAAEFLLIL